jgi:hypothetical protein
MNAMPELVTDPVCGMKVDAGAIWTLNGSVVDGLGDRVDLDFGFTPTTNLMQLRHIGLIEQPSGKRPGCVA